MRIILIIFLQVFHWGGVGSVTILVLHYLNRNGGIAKNNCKRKLTNFLLPIGKLMVWETPSRCQNVYPIIIRGYHCYFTLGPAPRIVKRTTAHYTVVDTEQSANYSFQSPKSFRLTRPPFMCPCLFLLGQI